MKRNIELFTILFTVASWTSSVAAAGSDDKEMSEDTDIVKIFDFTTASEDQLNDWWEVSDTVRYRNSFQSTNIQSTFPLVQLTSS